MRANHHQHKPVRERWLQHGCVGQRDRGEVVLEKRGDCEASRGGR